MAHTISCQRAGTECQLGFQGLCSVALCVTRGSHIEVKSLNPIQPLIDPNKVAIWSGVKIRRQSFMMLLRHMARFHRVGLSMGLRRTN